MKLFELEGRPDQEKDFPRHIMPQIRKEHLIDSPFDFQTGEVPILKLKPVQSQRVKGMHDKAKRGFDDGTIRPIIIDNDNFIVNGHHRYDIARGMDMEDVDVIKVDATIEELIKHYSNTADKQPTIEDKWKKNLKKKIKKMPKKISGSSSNILFNLGLAETIEAGQDFNALLQGIESDLKQREKDLKKLPKKSIYDENFATGSLTAQQMLVKLSKEMQGTHTGASNPNSDWSKYVLSHNGFTLKDIQVDRIPTAVKSDGMSQANIEKYKKADTSQFPPMVIGNNGYLLDGNHRLQAYKAQGIKTVKAYIGENFKDGKKPGRKGLAKRSGVNTKASVSSLRKTAKNSTGEKQRMAHWLANMKSGKKKSK